MYYNPDTKETKSRDELKALFNASIPYDTEQVGEDWFLIVDGVQEYREGMNAFEDGLKLIDGKWTRTYRYEPKTDEELTQMAKNTRRSELDNLVVEYNGVKYDADESSQSRMVRYISTIDDDNKTIHWIDANNQVQEITKSDLANILAMAVAETETLWVKPYTKNLEW